MPAPGAPSDAAGQPVAPDEVATIVVHTRKRCPGTRAGDEMFLEGHGDDTHAFNAF